MKAAPIRRTFALAAVAALAFTACGGDDSDESSGPSIEVTDAWARTSPMVATAGAAYMTIANTGDADDALVKASVDTSIAGTIELHETVAATADTAGGMTGDTSTMATDSGTEMMEMRPVDRIVVPAGGFATLAPGGYHVMMIDLVAPLAVGTSIDITLTFEQSGEQTVQVPVRDTAP
ncbi:MAG: copper chaperone PCu(A)C [Ilumatobacteraceae bacterium]